MYYYNARYYDPVIGRFISPDTVVQSFSSPQKLNRYSYCVNNPLKYTDPSGNIVNIRDPSMDAFLQQYDITKGGSMFTADPSSLLSDWLRLVQAYNEVGQTSIGALVVQELESRQDMITIKWAPWNGQDDVSSGSHHHQYKVWQES